MSNKTRTIEEYEKLVDEAEEVVAKSATNSAALKIEDHTKLARQYLSDEALSAMSRITHDHNLQDETGTYVSVYFWCTSRN